MLINELPPGAAYGLDVDEQGNGSITEQQLHQLIRLTMPMADQQLEIETLGADGNLRFHVRVIRQQ